MANVKKGVPAPRWTEEQLQFFVQGKKNDEIAQLTGRTPGAVSVKRSSPEVKKLLKKKSVPGMVTRKAYTKKVVAALPEAKVSDQTFFITVGDLSVALNPNSYLGVKIQGDTIMPVRK